MRDAEQDEQPRADGGDLRALHAHGGTAHALHERAHPGEASLNAVTGLLIALGGLAFVCLVLAIFVLITRFLAPRLLGKDDGSSLDP